MQQIVDYKNEPGNGYGNSLMCFMQLFIVSNRSNTYYFANNKNQHFAFNADEQFLPIYQLAEERIRTKLLKDNHIDTVIGLPSNLFYSTGIPVCILVLKKCKKEDDVLFINASEHFDKGKRQNSLSEKNIESIVETYKYRKETDRYSHKVSMDEIEKNGYNLNISRYVSTSIDEVKIDLKEVNDNLTSINERIKTSTEKHNEFLKELGLKTI